MSQVRVPIVHPVRPGQLPRSLIEVNFRIANRKSDTTMSIAVRRAIRSRFSNGTEASLGAARMVLWRQRFCRREAFARFLGDATFAAGTITLCTGITVGCPGSIPSC